MKKITAILLCALLVCCLLPVTALAGETEPTVYPVKIDGESFTSDKLEIICKNGKATYDPGTQTLTLDNVLIEAEEAAGIEFGSGTYKLILIGENVAVGENVTNGNTAKDLAGIFAEGATLEISGKGSLDVSGEIENHYNSSSPGKDDSIGDGYGIVASNLTVKSGTVTATGAGVGVYVVDDITVDGGSLTGKSNKSGGEIYTDHDLIGIHANNIIINDGSVIGIREITSDNPVNPSYAVFGDVVMNGGHLSAEVTSTGDFTIPVGDKSFEGTLDITNLAGYSWRVEKPGLFSEEELSNDLVIDKYFEIMDINFMKSKAPQTGAGEVHQITSVTSPVTSEETNPNTGADYSSILCAGAILVLAGAAAMLKGKKH